MTQHFKEDLGQLILRKQLAHAYILEGPDEASVQDLALWLAQSQYCQDLTPKGYPCQVCDHCRRVQEGNFPDVVHVDLQGTSIKVDQMRDLKWEVSRAATEGQVRVVIIPQADLMTASAANAILKSIEEPEAPIIFLLLTQRIAAILPTIQSRCQILHLPQLSPKELEERLVQEGIGSGNARLLVQLCPSLEEAKIWGQDPDFLKLKSETWSWFQMAVEAKGLAFVRIQTQILPLMASRKEMAMAFDLLAIFLRDGLLASQGLMEDLILLDKASDWHKLLQKRRKSFWLEAYQALEVARDQWMANVSFQGALENWLLETNKEMRKLSVQ